MYLQTSWVGGWNHNAVLVCELSLYQSRNCFFKAFPDPKLKWARTVGLPIGSKNWKSNTPDTKEFSINIEFRQFCLWRRSLLRLIFSPSITICLKFLSCVHATAIPVVIVTMVSSNRICVTNWTSGFWDATFKMSLVRYNHLFYWDIHFSVTFHGQGTKYQLLYLFVINAKQNLSFKGSSPQSRCRYILSPSTSSEALCINSGP